MSNPVSVERMLSLSGDSILKGHTKPTSHGMHTNGGVGRCHQTRPFQRLVKISAVLGIYAARSTRDIVQNYAVGSYL